MKSAERRVEVRYLHNAEKKDRRIRLVGRRLTQGPTPALCFASDSNLSLSPVHCAQVSSSSCCHLAHHRPSRARSLARSSVQADVAIGRRASGEHRIRWVDAYESPGAARISE